MMFKAFMVPVEAAQTLSGVMAAKAPSMASTILMQVIELAYATAAG